MSRIAAAFDRAHAYDDHAEVQRKTAAMLADRIAALPLTAGPRVLELGCGTGFLGTALIDRLPGADWLMTDLAPAMVERARARFRSDVAVRVMDGERPDVDGPFDLVCSSLAAQWFGDLAGALDRLAALLAPGGALALATLTAPSFAEWRAAHPTGSLPGLHAYPSAAALAALRPTGLAPAIEEVAMTVRYESARAFLRALKAIGAGTPRANHRPLAPTALREAMRRFEAAGARATYAVAFMIVRKPCA